MIAMWAVAILALLALVVNLVLHIASVVSLDPHDSVQPDWVLPVAAVAALVGIVLLASVVDARERRRAEQRGFAAAGAEREPAWFKPVLWVFIAYAVYHGFMGLFVDLRDGVPTR